MRSLLRTALASLGCAVLAACSDQPISAPVPSTGLRPSFALGDGDPIAVTLGCDVNAMRTQARLYANKSNDLLLTIIGDLGQLVKNGVTTPAGNDKAFDGLSRMAAIRGTSAQKPSATGAVFDDLVKRFIGCMQPALYANVLQPNPPTGPDKGAGFRQALGPGWVFEVRGKPTGTYADPPGPAYERLASPAGTTATWWALDKVGSSWASAINSSLTDCDPAGDNCDRVLIFGWRTGDFIPSNSRAGSSFEHRTLPDINKPDDPTKPETAGPDFLLDANVGLCFADDSQNPSVQRVNHDSKFLELAGDMNCGSSVPTISQTSPSLAFGPLNPIRLAQRAMAVFRPQPLYASTMFFGGSITGRPDDFSPSAVFDLSQIKLVFDTIANGFVNTPLTATGTPVHEVRVYAFSLDNTPVPIPGVDVVVKIAGNSSTISFFGGSTSPDSSTIIWADSVIAKGTPEGYAKLTGVTLTKAGGFTLAARVNVVGIVGNPFNSLSFQIQNKTGP